MYIFVLALVYLVLGIFAQEDEIPPELAATAYPDFNDTNLRGTWLWGFYGCDNTQKANIREAYDDFRTLSNTKGVLSDIDWNSAAALEYLGPAGHNKNQQKQIQAVFANAATVYPGSFLNPFRLGIYARCDDLLKKCPDEKCKTPKTSQPTLNAYSLNRDPDDPKWPMINFCPPFFAKRSLTNAYAFGSAQPGNEKFNIAKYINRAETMFHELLHLDNVADSLGGVPNPVVDDLTITISLRNSDDQLDQVTEPAYGATRSKLVARFQPIRGDFPTGYYIQRNATDNLVFFALAKYIQDKSVYPYIPVITEYKLVGPPWIEPRQAMEYASTDGQTALLGTLNLEPVPGCRDRMDDDSATALALGAPYDDAEYPVSYRIEKAQWLGSLSTPPPAGQLYPPRCQRDVLTEGIRSFSRDEAADKIREFCSNKAWWDVNIVPAVSFGDGSGHRALGVIDNFTVNGDAADKVYMDVSWKPGCMGYSLFTVGATDSDKENFCKTRFLTVLDGCDIASTEEKYGGSLVDSCLVYRLGAVGADTEAPFKVFPGGPEFSCVDADASSDPSLSKACTCFYTGEPETSALFDKPEVGCQSLKSQPATTFQGLGQPIVARATKRDNLFHIGRTHPRDTSRMVQGQERAVEGS